MAIDEQVIRLALDLGASPEDAAKLSAALDRINASGAKAAAEGLARAEAEIDSLIGSASRAAIPLEEVSLEMARGRTAALSEAEALRGLGIEMRATSMATTQLDTAATRYHATADHAAGRTKNVSAAVLQLSYGIQDVAIGSFAGLINNVDQFAQRMGASGPVVIGVSLLTTGIYVASRAIGGLIDEFQAASGHAIPKTGDALKDVSTALEATSKRLDALRESGRLNNAELAEYNRLSQEEIRLTREKEALKREREISEKAAALKPAGEAEQAKQVAEALQGSFGDQGSRQDLIMRVLGGMSTESLDRAKQASSLANQRLQESLTRDPLNLVGMQDRLQRDADQAMDRVRAESARMRSEAESMVNQAIVKGDLGAFRGLQEALGRRPGAFTDAQRSAIAMASPDAFAADEAFEREMEARRQSVKDRDERRKTEDARARADAEDAEAGRQMELAGREGFRKSQEKLLDEIEAGLDAEDKLNEKMEKFWARQDKAKADDAADLIKQATGGTLGADLTREAAERSVQLQQLGLDTQAATQQAIGEALQAMRELQMQSRMLGMQGAQLLLDVQRARQSIAQDTATIQRRGRIQ